MVDKKYRSEYTGEQIDAAVTKINSLDLNNYYDKSEINSELDKKLDKSVANEVYYNKTEINDQGHFENDAPNAQVSVGNLAAGTIVCDETTGDIKYSPCFIGSITSSRASGIPIKGSNAVAIVSVDNPSITFTYEYLW